MKKQYFSPLCEVQDMQSACALLTVSLTIQDISHHPQGSIMGK